MTKHDLAKALRGTVSGKWINIPGPHHSGKDRSLGILLDPTAIGGFRVNSLCGEDPIVCRTYVEKVIKDLVLGNEVIVEGMSDPDARFYEMRIKTALKFWNEAVPAQGTIVEQYLATRGCQLTTAVTSVDALRFHPSCRFGPFTVPAMVALMRDFITAKPTGIHRTALMDDGRGKLIMPNGVPEKMMLGRAKGAGIMLFHGVARKGIAEGIETALSAQREFQIPVWSCMSAGGIASFPVVRGTEHLTIFADHDKAGIEAAYRCASRYQRAGIKGQIRHSELFGSDWNSYLNGCQNGN